MRITYTNPLVINSIGQTSTAEKTIIGIKSERDVRRFIDSFDTSHQRRDSKCDISR